MTSMLAQATEAMKNTQCSCGSDDIEVDPETFEQHCSNCGEILEHSLLFSHTSSKGPSGELERTGTITNMRSNKINHDMNDAPILSNNNIAKKEGKMRNRINWVIEGLDDDYQNHDKLQEATEKALRIWRLCFDRKLTRGYDRDHLAAILFYMACRQMTPPLPYLLIDFAGILKINVYKLAKKFNKLCIDIPIHINSLTDPSIYIARFTNMLEFGDETENVTETACKLVDQMKADWITSGRRPSGICGACILIAARLHGFKRTIKEIVNVVNLSESTVKKRINEFLDTRIASMTVHTFHSSTRQQIANEMINKPLKLQEKPPIIKQQEKYLMRLQKKEELKKKNKKEVDEYDKQYDEENNINQNENSFGFNRNDDNESDDDIDFLMKPEPEHETIFVAATDIDESSINEELLEIKKSNSVKPKCKKSDKREMDASDSDDDEDDDINVNIKNNNNNNIINGIEIGSMSDNQTYISAASATTISDTITEVITDATTEPIIDGASFIVGANASQLDEYNEHNEYNEYNEYEDDKQIKIKQDTLKYHEENDLSYLDNDAAVKSMLLNEDEIIAKNKLFEICNPDWNVVKFNIDKRAMIKEEKEKKKAQKRNLYQTYKDDPHKFIAGKVCKRFRSENVNIDAYYRLTGQQNPDKSPSISIKKQDPMEND